MTITRLTGKVDRTTMGPYRRTAFLGQTALPFPWFAPSRPGASPFHKLAGFRPPSPRANPSTNR